MSRRDPSQTTAEHFDSMEDTEHVPHEMRGIRKKSREPGQLNMTSMMDICFQLLIFFVLTANFTVNEGILPADLPQGTGAAAEEVITPNPPLRITLSGVGTEMADVTITVDGAAPIPGGNFEALYLLLNGWRFDEVSNPSGTYMDDNPIIISPQNQVNWGAVVSTFNSALRARYVNINFAPASGGG